MTGSIGIFAGAVRAGGLELDGDGRPHLVYDPRWMATSDAWPVSLSMPKTVARHGPDAVEPWIAGLLPEEAPLRQLARLQGVSPGDSVALLAAIGGDTAGAFSFGAAAPRERWVYEPLVDRHPEAGGDEALALGAHVDGLAERPFMVGEEGIRVSLAGGQVKTVLAVLGPDGVPRLGLPRPGDRLAVPKAGAPSTLIVKPANRLLFGIVDNETYCLALASACGIEAAQACVLAAPSPREPGTARSVIAVARYDRAVRGDGGLRRLHQEDFAQALGVHPMRKYERATGGGVGIGDLAGVARRIGPADLAAFVEQWIFNLLVANTDAHAKNYAVLYRGPRPQLAPLYDVSTVLGWREVVQRHAQTIAGKARRPVDLLPRHWDAVADALAVNRRELRLRVVALVDRMVASRPSAVAAAVAAGAEPRTVDHVAALVEGHALRVAGRLSSRWSGG